MNQTFAIGIVVCIILLVLVLIGAIQNKREQQRREEWNRKFNPYRQRPDENTLADSDEWS